MAGIQNGPGPKVKLTAPAKVNLTLEVLGRRDDGYHEIRSIIQTVSLCDRLSFELSAGLCYSCDTPFWRHEQSLVPRAANLMKEESGYQGGAMIEIVKRIPFAAGLGGDSSDAAAALLGLNELWHLKIPPGRLVELAAKLGSDVPFFLTGGTALVQGRGELVSPLPSPARRWLVLLMPAVDLPPSKTAALYARVGKELYSCGELTESLVARLTRGEPVELGHLFNVFEEVAYDVFHNLEYYRQAMLGAGATKVHLAGAGPALFSLHPDEAEARRVCGALGSYQALVVATVDSGEAC